MTFKIDDEIFWFTNELHEDTDENKNKQQDQLMKLIKQNETLNNELNTMKRQMQALQNQGKSLVYKNLEDRPNLFN